MLTDYRSAASEMLTIHSDDGKELSCSCPFHNDRRPSFRLNVLSGLWFCHSCHEAGNIKKLYKDILGENLIIDDVAEYRMMLHKLEENIEPSYPSFESACVEGSIYQCDEHLEKWSLRGILDMNVISKFGLGFDAYENALTMPTEYGFVRRYLGQRDNKYLFPKGMLKSSMLYGYDFITNPVVAICEGQIDALACWQAGINALAIFGSSISNNQVEMMKQLDAQFLVLFLDDDEQGWEGNEKIKSKLGRHFAISEVDYTGYEGLDPASIPSNALYNLAINAVGAAQ